MVNPIKEYPKLRNCPFCGGEAVVDGRGVYWVKCKNCGVETRAVITKVAAHELWNRRVGDDLMERMEDDCPNCGAKMEE